MTKIKKLMEHIADELSDAKEYAEKYIECKASEKSTPAARYKEMAEDELKHARYIHDMAMQEIEALEKCSRRPKACGKRGKNHTASTSNERHGLSRC